MLRNSKTKITCFYCNQASFIHHQGPGPIRQFDCPQCTATNHFNERGEIIDYTPPPTSKAPVRYAYQRDSPRARAIRQDGPLVCRVCQNNHSIIVHQLAEYLPDESDPNYEYKAEHIDDYRRELEEKYPPLCDDCAPKVDDVIRKLNYKAKSQGLARLLENSRTAIKSRRPDSGLLLALLGAATSLTWYIWRLAYWTSVGLFAFWQLTTLMAVSPLESPEGKENLGWQQCLKSPIETGNINNACNSVASRWFGTMFPWVIALFAYDYKWMEVRRRPGSLVEGRPQYFLCQAVLAGLVSFNWWFLSPSGPVKRPEKVLVFTAACLMIEVLVMLQAFTTLKVSRPRAQFSLKESRPLVPTALPPSKLNPPQGNTLNGGGMRFRPSGPSFESVVQSNKPKDGSKPTPGNSQTSTSFSSQNSYGTSGMPAFGSQTTTSFGGSPLGKQSSSRFSSQATDPDAMDWNPAASTVLYNSQTFSMPRPSSRDNDSDDEDKKSEWNDSPVKNSSMRPKTLMIDGEFAQQTGLESLFNVAAKLDDAKPTNQPGITSRRWHRIGLEVVRFAAVCAGLYLLVNFEGKTAMAGVALAFAVGTCRKFWNALSGTDSRIQTSGDVVRRYATFAWCFLELCGSVIVSASMLGFHVLPSPTNRNIYPLGIEDPLALGIVEEIGSATRPLVFRDAAMPPSKSAMLELLTRFLFLSFLSYSGYALADSIFFKGMQFSEQEEEPKIKPEKLEDWNTRDVGIFTTVNNASFSGGRSPSPSPAVSGGGLPGMMPSFSGASTASGSSFGARPMSNRSNFSSWAPKNGPDVGIRNPAQHSFGSTTSQTVKVPPSGMPSTQPKWGFGGPPNFGSSSFQQPRGGGWGS